VMGTHGRRGLKRLTMGSDAEMVVRRANVPVLLAKAADAAA
jgi:nucleotide-binding universal stress UspA family protein